ncbi:MAG: MaoC family dehydratase N-terminal domain-containing protein [Betaproteobacteria bacterium]|nr:MaoC family dehydratase N-terminal domain-containing protein [Betaproteobacteria bacterium]
MDVTIDYLQGWIGKTESRSDLATAAPIAALSATLDRNDAYPQAGEAIWPLCHWLYFLPHHRHSELGADGHSKRGGFLPPVPLPRRMWAGGGFEFHRPICIGEAISRTSQIAGVDAKEGRSGALVFVKVRHEIANSGGLALTEEQDLVYRGHPNPADPAPSPKAARGDEAWAREVVADEVMLFRYSALTFNGHRIHYDYRYVTEVEGYPGLVVHGPLIATLLIDLLRRSIPDAALAGFSFRAVKPLFANAPFAVCGRPEAGGKTVALWARDAEGWLAMEAAATLA